MKTTIILLGLNFLFLKYYVDYGKDTCYEKSQRKQKKQNKSYPSTRSRIRKLRQVWFNIKRPPPPIVASEDR
jgi:hypothetical protein